MRDQSFILYLMVRDERPLLWVGFEYYNSFRIRIVGRIGISSSFDDSEFELSSRDVSYIRG